MADENRLEIVLVEAPAQERVRPVSQSPVQRMGTDGASMPDPRSRRAAQGSDPLRDWLTGVDRDRESAQAQFSKFAEEFEADKKKRHEEEQQQHVAQRNQVQNLLVGFAQLNTAVHSSAGVIWRATTAWSGFQRISEALRDDKERGGGGVRGIIRTVAKTVRAHPVATGFGLVAVAAASTVSGLNRLGNAAMQSAERLGSYSGVLAAARADADVRKILTDIRHAQHLGPDLARITELRSRREESMQNIGASIQKTFMPLTKAWEELKTAFVEFFDAEKQRQQFNQNFLVPFLEDFRKKFEGDQEIDKAMRRALDELLERLKPQQEQDAAAWWKQILGMRAPEEIEAGAMKRNREKVDPMQQFINLLPIAMAQPFLRFL